MEQNSLPRRVCFLHPQGHCEQDRGGCGWRLLAESCSVLLGGALQQSVFHVVSTEDDETGIKVMLTAEFHVSPDVSPVFSCFS